MHPQTCRAGQTAIELTLAVMASVVFIVCSFRVWVWLVRDIVERQEAYHATRFVAGREPAVGGDPGKLDYYRQRRLSVFNE